MLPTTDSPTGTPPFNALSAPSLGEIVGGMADPPGVPPRIYVDTSVIGGCQDDEFREPSRQIMQQFESGELTLILSRTTVDELKLAPEPVRIALDAVPDEHIEFHETSKQADRLAARYIAEGVLSARMLADATHVATATLAGARFLVSWNFKHLVNVRRIQGFNSINHRDGHPLLDIRTPREFLRDDI